MKKMWRKNNRIGKFELNKLKGILRDAENEARNSKMV